MNNFYFNLENELVKKHVSFIKDRRLRNIKGYNLIHITRGDILSVIFRNKSIIYKFEGICLGVRKKKLLHVDCSIIVRNIIFGIGMELYISYNYHRLHNINILDFKRKQFWYDRSKLYYLRSKLNRASRVE